MSKPEAAKPTSDETTAMLLSLMEIPSLAPCRDPVISHTYPHIQSQWKEYITHSSHLTLHRVWDSFSHQRFVKLLLGIAILLEAALQLSRMKHQLQHLCHISCNALTHLSSIVIIIIVVIQSYLLSSWCIESKNCTAGLQTIAHEAHC